MRSHLGGNKAVVDTRPGIHERASEHLADECKCAPIVNGGDLLAIMFERESAHGTGIIVHRLATRMVVARMPWDHGLGCAAQLFNERFP